MSHKICRVAHDKIFIWKNMSWNMSCATQQNFHLDKNVMKLVVWHTTNLSCPTRQFFLSNVCRVPHDTVVCILVETNNKLYTEIVSDIQNNFCTQHVLPMFCKKKNFWQRFTCNRWILESNRRIFITVFVRDLRQQKHEWKVK